MNKLLWLILGYRVVQIQGASPHWLLNTLAARRIPFWNTVWEDLFKVCVSVFPGDVRRLEKLAEPCQCTIEVLQIRGIPIVLRHLIRRPVLWISVLLTVLMVVLIPSRLLFFEVLGCESVEEQQVLRALEELGIGFGTYGPDVNPRWIKDHVLNMLPNLQWITVTQNGCKAQVVVRERPQTPTTLDRRGFAHVYATQSGMITEQSILAGQALKKPGDFVLEGERLVTGLVNLDRVYALEYAQAEIFARTWRKQTLIIPEDHMEKTVSGKEKTIIWLEVGKERRKIFGNSGISTAACDKMIRRRILSLPGGLKLPISVLIETVKPCDLSVVSMERTEADAILRNCAEETAAADMVAGEILQRRMTLQNKNGCYRMASVLECHEMIARTVEAKWNEKDFLDDGKNN